MVEAAEKAFFQGDQEAHARRSDVKNGKLDPERRIQPQQPPIQPQIRPKCPRCGYEKLWRAGFNAKGAQLLFCCRCFRRFSEKAYVSAELLERSDAVHKLPDGIISFAGKHSLDQGPLVVGEDVSSHKLSVAANSLSTLPSCNRERRVCVSEVEMKNLGALNEPKTSAQDNRTEQTEQALKGEIVTFSFHLTKMNLDKKTIYSRARNVELLHRCGANLSDPDSVLTVLATTDRWKTGTKNNILQAYRSYAKWKKIDLSTVDMPTFKSQTELRWVPKETLLDQLISGAGWKTGTFCQLLKESGARTIEAARIY